jgi:hypothetical protein
MACAGKHTVSFTNVNVSNPVTAAAENCGNILNLFDVHMECIEKELNGLLTNSFAECDTLVESIDHAGLKSVENFESDCETELISVVTNYLHAFNCTVKESFLICVNEVIGPVVIARTDEDGAFDLNHLVKDSAEEFNACCVNCGICAADVLILGRAKVSRDLKAKVLRCYAELFKLSIAHVYKVACAYFENVKTALLCSVAKVDVVNAPCVVPVSEMCSDFHSFSSPVFI